MPQHRRGKSCPETMRPNTKMQIQIVLKRAKNVFPGMKQTDFGVGTPDPAGCNGFLLRPACKRSVSRQDRTGKGWENGRGHWPAPQDNGFSETIAESGSMDVCPGAGAPLLQETASLRGRGAAGTTPRKPHWQIPFSIRFVRAAIPACIVMFPVVVWAVWKEKDPGERCFFVQKNSPVNVFQTLPVREFRSQTRIIYHPFDEIQMKKGKKEQFCPRLENEEERNVRNNGNASRTP